jgi:threonine dehydrogenase-like Zn-dependent dehydrogenase
MLAAASGAEVIGVDLIPDRLELAKGAAHVLMGGEDAAQEIRDLTDGRGAEVAREWGWVVYIAEVGSVTFEPSPLLHKQLTLHGSWVCGINEMEGLLEHLERKGLHPESTVTHTFSLSDTKQAYEIFDAGKTGKVVILL